MGWAGRLLGGIAKNIPIIGMAADAYAQHSANKTNKKMAREQMAFQERMSSTEVQRRVQDMLNAGINPMLAAGTGASSPGGASAQIDPITRNTASSALAIQSQRAALDNMHEQTRLLKEQQLKTRADTELAYNSSHAQMKTAQRIEHETMNLAQDFKRKIIELDISDEQLKQARLNTAQLQKMQPLLEEYQRLVNQAQKLGMTQREVDQQFAKELGEASKYVRFIQQLFGTPRGDVK